MIRAKGALALMCVASPGLLAAQSFEGTVSLNITSETGTVRSMTFMLKGGKMRFDVGGGQMSVIIDPAAQRLMVIITAQRMYTESDFGGALAAVQQQAGAKNPSVTRTGKMETVAGYKCEHVTVTDDDGQSVDACISAELGGFRMPAASNPMSPQREARWMAQLGSRNFPLKVREAGRPSWK